MDFDELRARLPGFGLALSAYEPGAPVTLEVITPDGESFTFEGSSAGAVLERASDGLSVPSDPTPEPTEHEDVFS